jgi:hypothetical protein
MTTTVGASMSWSWLLAKQSDLDLFSCSATRLPGR